MSNYKSTVKELKATLKGLASEIKSTKSEFKDAQRSNSGDPGYELLRSLYNKKFEYRHKHIAYCIFRGKTYEQIELKCREDNKPDMKYIEELLSSYSAEEVSDEAIRTSA
jgi:hypothetical protein